MAVIANEVPWPACRSCPAPSNTAKNASPGIHRVVVSVPGDLVPRFEERGHHESVGREGARRHQLPHQIRRRRQRRSAAQPPKPLAVGHLADQYVAEQTGERPTAPTQLIVVAHLEPRARPAAHLPGRRHRPSAPTTRAHGPHRPTRSHRAGRPARRRCPPPPPGPPALGRTGVSTCCAKSTASTSAVSPNGCTARSVIADNWSPVTACDSLMTCVSTSSHVTSRYIHRGDPTGPPGSPHVSRHGAVTTSRRATAPDGRSWDPPVPTADEHGSRLLPRTRRCDHSSHRSLRQAVFDGSGSYGSDGGGPPRVDRPT